MTPRIRIRHGIWVCCLVDPRTRMALHPMGHGYTRDRAVEDWKAQIGSTRP